MTHNTKRGLSILMALLLVLSMLTGIVLPASAETAQQAVDPYAKIEATADGDVLIPADNVYFYSPTFATAPEGVSDGDAFEYTYGDGAIWGNGKTYQLTWGVNTLATIGAVKSAIIAYNSAWSADPTSSSEDLVIVFAPGTSGYLNNFELKAAGGVADPTPDELMNLYLLGPQAGKSPVNAARDTKADAKEIQNDRSIDTTTEHTFTSTFWVPSYCDFYFDGFAATTACRLYNGYTYTNHYISNLYVQDLKTPAGHSIFCSLDGRQITWDFENCYFNMNVSMNNSDMAKATSESNDIYANKVIFNNCVFAEGKLSEKHPNNQTHHIKVWPLAADKASANFFGEYATAPLISVTNCVGVDWESAHLFRFPLNAAHYAGYNNNVVQIDITGNKFYDVGTVAATSDIFFLDKVSTADQADSFTLNISDNLFSFSDEVFGQGATGVAGVINANNALAKEGSTVITSKYKITVTDNIFRLPNNKNNSPFLGGNASTMVPIDVSGNLFVDNQNNILPAFLNGASPTSYGQTWVVQSDIYASDTMQGGVRELMTVREVENGTVLYSYITLQRRGNLCDFDYFTGALTLLLKRGVNYDANTLIKFNDPDVKFLGIYSEAACTNKVDTITQDTINGKYAKAEYKAGNTTLTVVYTLNTPRNYLIVDPTGAYADGYTFNGVTYKNGEKATDGVFAKFYTQIDNGSGNDVSAYAAATNPNTNDLLAVGTQTFTDYDGQAYTYNNNMNTVIVLTPGTYEFTTKNKDQGMGKSVAIVGPYFATSPYDAAAAKEGKLANGRSLDPTKEAVVKGTIAPSADNSLNYVVDGVAFAGDLNAYTANGDSKLTGSMFQTHVIKNCVFGGNSPYGIVRADCSATSNKVMDLTVKDCVFDGTNVTRTGSNALILARANFCNLENIAVINDTSKLESTNRLAYITLTDGSKLKWTAKRTYADANNITIYNSNRNVIIYTLRDTTTVNANYDYYPDGVELNVTNTYVTGGMGYLFGVQGGQATGSEEFIKLTATDNYYYRPDYTGNEVENYQTSGYTNIDIFTADSVMEDNVLISNEKFLAKAYGDDLNIDDNFFGKVVDGKVVASYVSSSSTGVVKNTKEYWINEEMTVKNTDLGLVDNGYKSIEMGDWKGYNQYAVDATNITATPSMFKAAEGAAIEGVYTDAACTTAATAFTHPQIVYVKVTKGDLSVVNAVKVDCVCAHDGTTTEQIIEAPTCTLSGSKGYVCEYCGDLVGEVTEIPKNGHTPSTELSVDTPATCQTPGVGHYNCTVCPEVAEANVEISVVDCVAADEKVIDRQPNCTDRGEAHTVCKWCGKTLESGLEVGVGDHIWNTEYSVIEEATCTQQGQEAITCSICGTIKTGSDVMTDPLPHPWNTEYTVDVEPTCQEDGSESIHCSVCGTQQEGSSRTIEKGQHVWGTTYTVDEEATCTDYGMESIHCTLCDASQEGSQRRTPKADHAWNTEYTVDVEPTCSEEGEQSIYCSVCDTLKEGSTVAIPTTPHNWDTEFTVDWFESCTEPGQQSKYCLDCGAQTEITAIPAAGHGEGEWVITVAPTYQTAGVETSFCEYCGEVLDTRVVAKLQGANAATVFVDVSEGDWFYKNDAVNFVYNTGLMNGTTTTTFSPDAPITRGMFITILGRLSGEDVSQYSIAETGFKDVSKTAYYADYIAWGYENGIINGYSATVFGPDKNITREQICKMLLEYCNYEGITAVATEKAVTFADASQISGYAKKYVKTCQRAGLVNGEKVGSKYYFRPQDTATRAEAATMIRNLCYTYMF